MHSLTGLLSDSVGETFTTGFDEKMGAAVSAYFMHLIHYSVKNGNASRAPATTERDFFRKYAKSLPQQLVALRRQALGWANKNKAKPIKDLWASLQKERATNLPKWVTPLQFDPAEFAFVFWATLGLKRKDVIEPLLVIANAGGDTDTIASLYGSFLGAHHGAEFFDKHLNKPLEDLMNQVRADGFSLAEVRKSLAAYGSEYRDYRRMRKAAIAEHRKTGSKATEVGDVPKNALLVDVRSRSEIEVSMIEGAMTKAEFEKLSMSEKKGRPVVFYCTIGYRSGLVAKKYEKLGLQATNLIGGVSAWAFAGKPFVLEQRRTKPQAKATRTVHTYNADWDFLPKNHPNSYRPVNLPKPN